MSNSNSQFWDSCSSGHSCGFDDSSSSRWEMDETPAFPCAFSALVSPRLPRRQRSHDSNEEEDMIDILISQDQQEEPLSSTSFTPQGSSTVSHFATAAGSMDDDIRSNSIEGILHLQVNDAQVRDCPRQTMDAPQPPQRQLSNMVATYSGRTRLIQMRLQSLQKNRERFEQQQQQTPQQSSARWSRSSRASRRNISAANTGLRMPERQTGFYDFNRSSTI